MTKLIKLSVTKPNKEVNIMYVKLDSIVGIVSPKRLTTREGDAYYSTKFGGCGVICGTEHEMFFDDRPIEEMVKIINEAYND